MYSILSVLIYLNTCLYLVFECRCVTVAAVLWHSSLQLVNVIAGFSGPFSVYTAYSILD